MKEQYLKELRIKKMVNGEETDFIFKSSSPTVNDEYSVLHQGEFVDLFGEQQETVTEADISKHEGQNATLESDTITLPASLGSPLTDVEHTHIKSISFKASPSLGKMIMGMRYSGMPYGIMEKKLFTIQPVDASDIVEYQLDGTDSRVVFNPDSDSYVENMKDATTGLIVMPDYSFLSFDNESVSSWLYGGGDAASSGTRYYDVTGSAKDENLGIYVKAITTIAPSGKFIVPQLEEIYETIQNSVSFTEVQSLTTEQKNRAKSNIGAITPTVYVNNRAYTADGGGWMRIGNYATNLNVTNYRGSSYQYTTSSSGTLGMYFASDAFEISGGGSSDIKIDFDAAAVIEAGDNIAITEKGNGAIIISATGGGSSLPTNDKYSVLNEGEFVDLFEEQQVIEVITEATKYDGQDATEASNFLDLPISLKEPLNPIGDKLIKSISFKAAPALGKLRMGVLTTGAFYGAMGLRIFDIQPDSDADIVEYLLDGTDSRVVFNPTNDPYVEYACVDAATGLIRIPYGYIQFENEGASSWVYGGAVGNSGTSFYESTGAENDVNIGIYIKTVDVTPTTGKYVVPGIEELYNSSTSYTAGEGIIIDSDNDTISTNIKTINGQSLIKTDTETDIAINSGTITIDTSGDISNMQNDTAYLVTIIEDTDLSTLSIENQSGIITTSELWLDAANDSTVTYPSSIVWEGTPVTSLTANTAYRFSVRDDLGTTVIKLNYSYIGTPTNPNKVCLPDGTINLEDRENVIGGPCIVDGTSAFYNKKAVTNISGNWTNLTNATSMFRGTTARTDTSTYPALTNMTSMYQQVTQIQIDKIDESNFPNVTISDKAFQHSLAIASTAEHIAPSVVSLPKVTSAIEMFDGAIKFNTHPDNINFPLLENAMSMFGNTRSWNIDSGTLKFPKVTNTHYMFFQQADRYSDYALFNPDKIELDSATILGSNMFRARIHMKKTKIYAPNLENTTDSTFSPDGSGYIVDLDREALDYLIANIPDYSSTGGEHVLYIGGMTHAVAVTPAANAKGWTVADIVRGF